MFSVIRACVSLQFASYTQGCVEVGSISDVFNVYTSQGRGNIRYIETSLELSAPPFKNPASVFPLLLKQTTADGV